MITGKRWPAWLHRHKIAAVLFGAALVAASVFVVFHDPRGDTQSLWAVARSNRDAGATLVQAHQLKEAEQTYRQTLLILDRMIARRPDERSFRRERADVLDAIGVIQAGTDRLEAAESTDEQVITAWAILIAEDPSSVDERLRMAACINRLGLRLRESGRWEEAEVVYVRGRRLCENIPNILTGDPRIRGQLAVVLEQLALLLLDMGRGSEALECYASAVQAQAAAAKASSSGSAELARLASLLIEQSRALAARGRSSEAERALVDAVSASERLKAASSSEATYDDIMATALSDLGDLIQVGIGRATEARVFFDRASAIREKRLAKNPDEPDAIDKLAAAYVSLAGTYLDPKSTGDAEAVYRKGLAHYARLASEHPQMLGYRFGYGQALHKLADLLRDRGRFEEARPIARESIERLSGAYAANIRNPYYRAAISGAYWTLCAIELDRKNHREAARAVREYRRIEPNGFDEALESARFLCRCARLSREDQSTSATELDALAHGYTDQAMEALRSAGRGGFRDVNALKTARTYEPLRARDDFQQLVRYIEARVEAVGQAHGSDQKVK